MFTEYLLCARPCELVGDTALNKRDLMSLILQLAGKDVVTCLMFKVFETGVKEIPTTMSLCDTRYLGLRCQGKLS